MSGRDEFSAATKRLLAEQAGFQCSNPACRRKTIGPDSDEGSTSIGVAAHITAASKGGPRYNIELSDEERRAPRNGIWLCQTCSRLIDVDEIGHTEAKLHEWKQYAESVAFLELRGFTVKPSRIFDKLEAKLPELVAEMRSDLLDQPFVREFIALSKKAVFNYGRTPLFSYYHQDHDQLLAKLKIMENYGAISDASINNVPRYKFSEEFVEFLEGG